VAETLSVSSRFNGPTARGQGGYCSAAIADFVDGQGEVSLRNPVPLETELHVVRADDGSVRVLDGGAVIAEAVPIPPLDLDVPHPVSPGQAAAAKERYRGSTDDLFSHCFVCGMAREDSLGVFAGAVDGREVVASPWKPPSWTADDSGRVRTEFLWAVMDCPAYFAVYPDEQPMSFLARMTARVDAPVTAGDEHVVLAWPISTDGRKRTAGAAVLSGTGDVLATARVLMIEPREAPRL
jgi:hypothetical protein